MHFSFLHPYKIDTQTIDVKKAKKIGRMRHFFYAVPELDLQELSKVYDTFPVELSNFYNEIGFGLLNRHKGKLNLLLDPVSLINTNQRLGYFKDDAAIMAAMEYCENNDQLLFFKTYSNQYLSINIKDDMGKNAVFYKGKQIQNSLYEFLEECDNNKKYFDKLDDKVAEKKCKKDNDINAQDKYKDKKRIAGHILIDPY